LQPIPLLGRTGHVCWRCSRRAFLFNGPARAQNRGILAGATLIAAVGILDDRGLLHHQVKLFIGMPLAAGILLLSGIRAQVFSTMIGGPNGDLLDIALTVVWVVGITASFSILYHMDGLCAGIAAMASVFRASGLFAWSDIGDGAGCGRTWRGHRIPTLELQAREDFHGRRRSDVPRLSDGHPRFEAAPREFQHALRVGGAGSGARRNHF
jgi:hypothetical protein